MAASLLHRKRIIILAAILTVLVCIVTTTLLLQPSSNALPIVTFPPVPVDTKLFFTIPEGTSPTVLTLLDDKGFVVTEAPSDEKLFIPDSPCNDSIGFELRNRAEYVVDNRGYACSRQLFDHRHTYCCLSRFRYPCISCHNTSGCCFLYSGCVSCCMGRLGASLRSCAYKCRTSSISMADLIDVRSRPDDSMPQFCFTPQRAADRREPMKELILPTLLPSPPSPPVVTWNAENSSTIEWVHF